MDTNKMRDLKVLAKAATPGQWVTDGEYVNEHGNVLFAYVAHENSGRIAEAFVNCLVKTTEQCRANAAFIAAANPSTVLALLAEIDRLERKNGSQAESIRQYRDHLEGDDSILSLTNERDQLKDENDTLKAAAMGIRDAWREDQVELEALRKDAERWRFVRNAVPNRSPFAVWHEGSLPFLGSKADEAVDAAMAKEASRG